MDRGPAEHRHTVVAAVSDAGLMNKNLSMMYTNPAAADAALAMWLPMWNSDSEIALRICSAEFRINFLVSDADGSNPFDDVLGAQSFARYLDRWRAGHPGVVFTEVARAVDGTHGRMLWNMQVGDAVVGGIDVFDFTEDGLIRQVWSVNGTRAHLA